MILKNFWRFLCLLLVFLLLSSILIPVFADSGDNGDTIVYVTATGTKYHRGSCGYLRSRYEITLREAVRSGYTPCSRCSPPRFNGSLDDKDTDEEETAPRASSGSSSNHSGNSGSSGTTRRSGSSGSTSSSIGTNNQNSSKSVASSSKSSGVSNNKKTTSSFPWKAVIPWIFVLGIPFVIYLWTSISLKIDEHKNKPVIQEKELQVYHQQIVQKDQQNQIRDSRLSELNNLRNELPVAFAKLIQTAKTVSGSLNTFDYCISRISKIQENQLKANRAYFDRGMLCTRDGQHYGDSCTVYYSTSGSCYHKRDCSYNRGLQYAHILHTPFDKRPCSYCSPYPRQWMAECENRQQVLDRLIRYKKNILSLDVGRAETLLERYNNSLKSAELVLDYANNTVTFKSQSLPVRTVVQALPAAKSNNQFDTE